jgi:hypothetical protein
MWMVVVVETGKKKAEHAYNCVYARLDDLLNKKLVEHAYEKLYTCSVGAGMCKITYVPLGAISVKTTPPNGLP